MNTNRLYSILAIILSDSEMNRITISIKEEKITITIDVHKLNRHQARRLINNIINILQIAFELIIIHGYNHGTAIKDMLTNNFNNIHIIKKYVEEHNQGVTHMLITA